MRLPRPRAVLGLVACALGCAADGGGRAGPAAPATLELTVATFNLMNQSGDWALRRPHVARALAGLGADVLAFQEVLDVPGGDVQSAWLGEVLGLAVVFAPTVTYPRDVTFGLAVATRFPVLARDSWPLPAPEDDPRALQHVAVDTPLGPLHVYNTHLSYRFDQGELRMRQVDAILQRIGATNGDLPPLLLGDLNAPPDAPPVQRLVAPGGHTAPFLDAWRVTQGYRGGPTWNRANPLTAAGAAPTRRIDYVLVGRAHGRLLALPVASGLFCNAPGADGTWPSDHAGVHARIRFQAPAP